MDENIGFKFPLGGSTKVKNRSYKCPKCGGEFDSWFSKTYSDDKKCPFCGLKQGNYEGEN